MSVSNRADLLIQLIRKDDSANVELFDMLVPNYHMELHYLYSILDNSNVISSCKFNHPPSILEGELNIRIDMPGKGIKKCIKYIEKNDSTFNFIKKHTLRVKFEEKSKSLLVVFTTSKEEVDDEAST